MHGTIVEAALMKMNMVIGVIWLLVLK